MYTLLTAASCPPVPQVQHASADGISTQIGVVINFECLPNYWFSPGVTKTSIECLSFKTWDKTITPCTGTNINNTTFFTWVRFNIL